jgi:hypothetical protein
LYEEDDYQESILYLERWDSEPDFQRHALSERYRQILEAVELSRRAPEIQFYQVKDIRGIDLLEELQARNRSQKAPTAELPVSQRKRSQACGG